MFTNSQNVATTNETTRKTFQKFIKKPNLKFHDQHSIAILN